MMNTEELLYWAQTGDLKAMEELFLQYRPLLISRSMVGGRFCEDLYQELSITFLGCIQGNSSDSFIVVRFGSSLLWAALFVRLKRVGRLRGF